MRNIHKLLEKSNFSLKKIDRLSLYASIIYVNVMHPITTVINFCTNDYQFLRPCIREAKCFSSQILIPVADHFYDGTPENRDLLNQAYGEHSDCEFIEFAYNSERPYGFPCLKRPEDLDWSRHWHSTARMVAFHYLRPEIEYVLFIDVDEIYEGKKCKAWLDHFDYRAYCALRFLSYEYFRETGFRAKDEFTSGILAKKSCLTPKMILNVDERLGLYRALPEKKIMNLKGLDGVPFIHHYSWVRSKEQMLKKVTTWAHHWEKNWVALVEKEFSGIFSGRDFFSDREYETVKPYIDLPPQPAHRTDASEIFHKDLAFEFDL